jgi:hypothetical protein
MDYELSVKRTSTLIIAALIIVLLLFEVSLDLQFSLPGEEKQPDFEQEALFAACYEKRDAEIHRIAFGTIDNPDVQKEFINTNRERATANCRRSFPATETIVTTPLRMNLLDFEPRYW